MILFRFPSFVGLCTLLTASISSAELGPLAAGQAASAPTQSKFTPPPGQETDEATKLIAAAAAALRSGKSTTDLLTDVSFMPAHEWPRFRKLIAESARSSQAAIVTPNEPGEPMVVSGRVLDRDAQPLEGAVVYVYQTSARGWYSDRAAHYSANEGDRKHARLFGYLKTDAKGLFELRTIRPAGYPDSDLPAHIHVEATALPSASVVTEIQFDDDPRLSAEWRRRSRKEGFVIAKVKKDNAGIQRVQVELKMR